EARRPPHGRRPARPTRSAARRRPARAARGPTWPTSDDVVLFGLGAAADRDRARLLEAAHDADDLRLGLVDHLAALRRRGLHVLEQHLRAALGHVAEHPLAELR